MATSIAATIRRYAGGSGNTTITHGIAFRPGDVTTTLLTDRQLRVFVEGVEQAIYTEALDGRHFDNSVKVVLIQFIRSVTGTHSAEIRLGEARVTVDIAKQTLSSWPRVFLTPTDTFFLCTAVPFWYVLTPMTNLPSSPSYWGVWRDKYASTVPYTTIGSLPHWNDALAAVAPFRWEQLYPAAGYQWARHHYDYFCMTGDTKYLDRAIGGASFIVEDYHTPNSFGTPEHYGASMVDVLLHYWMTGLTSSRDGIRLNLNNSSIIFNSPPSSMSSTTYIRNHGRIHHNGLAGVVMGYHLNLSPVTNIWGSETAATWQDKALKYMEAALTQQFSDGHNTWPDTINDGGTSTSQYQFQWGLRSTAMLMYYAWVDPDSRILSHIQAGMDHINQCAWNAATLSWSYLLNTPCNPIGSFGAELNGFQMGILGWLFAKTGDTAYKTRGDEAMNGLAVNAFWPEAVNVPKQFNEINWGTMAYIADRIGASPPPPPPPPPPPAEVVSSPTLMFIG